MGWKSIFGKPLESTLGRVKKIPVNKLHIKKIHMCHFSFLEKQASAEFMFYDYVLWCPPSQYPTKHFEHWKKTPFRPDRQFSFIFAQNDNYPPPPSTRCFLLPNKYMLERKSLRLLFLEGGPRLVYTSPQQPLTFCAPLPKCGNKYEKERLDFMKRVILLHRGGEMRSSPLGELLHKIKDCREYLKWDLDLVSILFPDFSPEEVKQITPWTTTD